MRVPPFGLNSREFYEAVTPAPEPHVWAGGLPREPRWARVAESLSVAAENDEDGRGALGDWLGHVEAGRIGQPFS
jgi:hypothetical protein